MTEPDNSIFAENNVLPAILIVLLRLYDVNMTLLRETNKEAAKNLAELHEQGHVVGPPPALIPEEPDV